MSELLKNLDAYGVNIQETMNRFLYDEELYEECFLAFLQDEVFEELDLAMTNQEFEKAFEYAHTLKGVSGNLGLTPFYQAVFTLVEALRHKEYENIAELYTLFLRKKRQLHEQVRESKERE